MEDKKIKWLIYTVLFGSIPILSRLLIWVVTQTGTISMFAASDFIAFGMILHISNINETEHLSDRDKSWKTVQNGTSFSFIILYSILSALIMLNEGVPSLVDASIITYCAMAAAAVSLIISFTVFHRISKIPLGEKP
jgi:CRISPR/Cas system CMR-associated protein Cmr3 (group 5 of RAMP superfamily)